MIKKFYGKKGITLVSLVITIVIMLILAGVSISFIIGQNGLFTKSNASAKAYSKEAIKEELKVALASASLTENQDVELSNDDIANSMSEDLPDITWVYKTSLAGRYKGYDFTIVNGEIQMDMLQKAVNNNRMVNHNQASTEFWAYKDKINEITFNIKKDSNINTAVNLPTINNGKAWDISANIDGSASNTGNVIAYFTDSGNLTVPYNLVIESSELISAPENSSNLFANMTNVSKYNNPSNFDTSNVTNMSGMYLVFGTKITGDFSLGDNFYTSNVLTMDSMFESSLTNIESFNIGNNFDTSNVTNMMQEFFHFGENNLKVLDLGNKFDTSKVYNMSYMFCCCGTNIMTTLDLGDKFDLSSVSKYNTDYMFHCCGQKVMTKLYLGAKFALRDNLGIRGDDFYLVGTNACIFYCAPENKDMIKKYIGSARIINTNLAEFNN